ncbi:MULTISPECIES: hypothetical protein [unclassified Polaribacter]|jgi:hypothetical protein|uniref:hypothetical protein n=1 Tax=unclassified Polaribacter TaxID=196858 RepID=UPI001C4E597F|nr:MULTISPECIES: hypothetical protein [unclassified Polaribacter]QXP64111.1 hypothetical protein H0I27_02655 [Polaribacter sp. HaHaR_3_91]QXP66610.1 hypothetical protein H0I28_15820 [Polaribacter sp. AHE13PA]QXP72091.1 hypothetical protein H0I29_08520 [Polaribacter sp. R2A056_3_33]
MKFYKFISVMLHPIVIPTIGITLYFILIQNSFSKNQKFAVLGLIFVTTYLVPLLILILFRRFKLIKSFKAESIKERKVPVAMMIVLFYLLGNTLYGIANLRDLGMLFYATSLGLVFIYILFAFKIKTSIHLISIGITIGFFYVLSFMYQQNLTAVLICGLLLSGILASARLHLKAHTHKEVYLGFILGFVSPSIVFYFL